MLLLWTNVGLVRPHLPNALNSLASSPMSSNERSSGDEASISAIFPSAGDRFTFDFVRALIFLEKIQKKFVTWAL